MANTREQILNSAEVLFAQKGFKATTLKDVSAASGVNSALVSYYFGNKEGLRRQIFLRQSASTQALIDSVVETGTQVTAEDVQGLVKSLLNRIKTDATYYRLNLWALVDGGEVTEQVAAEVWNPFFSRFKNILKELNPRLEQIEIEARCTLLCGSIHQYANLRWNFIEKIKFDGEPQALLQEYEKLILDKVLNVCLS